MVEDLFEAPLGSLQAYSSAKHLWSVEHAVQMEGAMAGVLLGVLLRTCIMQATGRFVTRAVLLLL